MQILKTVEEMQAFRKANLAKKIGLVPTMGNLHDGHLSLIKIASSKAEITVVSIFINPTQFSYDEDLESYPRTFDKDIEKLQELDVDVVFAPDIKNIYPYGINNTIMIEPPKAIINILCGINRPYHFQGVATVVAKLLQIINPDIVVFGEKDFQQLAIIRCLIQELFIDVSIYSGKIIREYNGLAMSSRNKYLSSSQYQQASVLYKTLLWCRQQLLSANDIDYVLEQGKIKINNTGIKTDYLDFRDVDNLSNYPVLQQGILLVAARIGNTRLIDNLRIIN